MNPREYSPFEAAPDLLGDATSLADRMTHMGTCAEAARAPSPAEAIELGWSIIPCDRNKKPRVRWKSFQDCRPTPKEVEEWSLRNPATWAFVTGQISERITLDFDGDPGRQALKKLGLTPHRRTPSGGYHVDFLHPGWYVPTLNSKSKRELGKRWPGVDIRGDGGYAIFSGRTDRGEYRRLRDPQPEALDILPKELREFLGLLHPPAGTQVPWPNGDLHLAPERRRVDTERLIRTALDKAASEGRNNAGFWLATQLRDNNYAQNEAQAICQEYAARCPATNAKGHIEPYNSDEFGPRCARSIVHRPARRGASRQHPLAGHDVSRSTGLRTENMLASRPVRRRRISSAIYITTTETRAG